MEVREARRTAKSQPRPARGPAPSGLHPVELDRPGCHRSVWVWVWRVHLLPGVANTVVWIFLCVIQRRQGEQRLPVHYPAPGRTSIYKRIDRYSEGFLLWRHHLHWVASDCDSSRVATARSSSATASLSSLTTYFESRGRITSSSLPYRT